MLVPFQFIFLTPFEAKEKAVLWREVTKDRQTPERLSQWL